MPTVNLTAPSPSGHGMTGIIRQFTPNWFTATMGTGVLALALNQVSTGLHEIAEAFWIANVALFAVFSALYAARWILFFDDARRIFDHPVMSMFLGAIPMGLATIINGLLVFGLQRWGGAAVAVAQALWWLDAAMSVACGVLIPFLMFTRQDHGLQNMTAVWLLPVVAAEVAAATAALLVPHLADPQAALRMLAIGYALWAFSVPVAVSLLVILLLRLVLHKLPPSDMAATMFLSLGPIGTGALGLLLLGADAPPVFAAVGLDGYGAAAAGIGIVGGIMFWGYGAWWLLLAVLTTARTLRPGLPFNLGWWGFTFPLGVFSLATLTLGRQLHFDILTAIGTGLVTVLALLWTLVAARTLHGVCARRLLFSPVLAAGVA